MMLLLGISNCTDEFSLFDDEFSLTASYLEVAIINSNICLDCDKHYIRVQRSFIADDFTQYAHNMDSLYYDSDEIEVNAYIIRANLIEEGQVIDADTLRKYECRDTIINIDETGYIGVENLQIFYFTASNLKSFGFNETYLCVEVKNDENKYYAHTKIVDNIKYELSQYANTFPIEYNTFDVSMQIPKYTNRYIATMNCRYIELRHINGVLDTVEHTLGFPVADVTYNSPTNHTESATYRLSVSSFYSAMEKHVVQFGDEENAISRRLLNVYFSSFVFNEDLLLVNNALQYEINGFSTTPTYFSNIENGLGCFSAYGKSDTRNYYFTSRTIRQFIAAVGDKYLFIP
jgi:hypothetical protein